MKMRELNEYQSKELIVLLRLLESTSPKLVTDRTLKCLWKDRLSEAISESKESEQELSF